MSPPPGSSPTSPLPAPPGSPSPTTPPAGYVPPDGSFQFKPQSSTQGPSRQGEWVAPSGVASAPASFDGPVVSSPPELTLRSGLAGTSDLNAGPSVIRIPASAGGGSDVMQASAAVPAAPTP